MLSGHWSSPSRYAGDPFLSNNRPLAAAPLTAEAVQLVEGGDSAVFWREVNHSAAANRHTVVARIDAQYLTGLIRPENKYVDTKMTKFSLLDPETGHRIGWQTVELGNNSTPTADEAPMEHGLIAGATGPSTRLLMTQINVTPAGREHDTLYVRFDGWGINPSIIQHGLDQDKWYPVTRPDIPMVVLNPRPEDVVARQAYGSQEGLNRLFSAVYRAANQPPQ